MRGESSDEDAHRGETKQKILELLLDGPKSAGEVADILHIQKSAARVHLESLQAEQNVKSRFKIERLGRPKKVYELTDYGRELFPRKYDLILNLVLKRIAEREGGPEEARKLVESVADSIAADIRNRIEKSSGAGSLEDALKVLNSVSNDMGFVSTVSKESDAKDKNNSAGSAFNLQSKNCILHKVAIANQDAICHGLHDRIILKSLGGKSNVSVELKECMALGNACCKHVITNKNKEKN
jgi:DeoR family transcriptional regulator, suf operon transcriptional repressor